MGMFDNINKNFLENAGRIIYDKIKNMPEEEAIDFLKKGLKESVTNSNGLAISNMGIAGTDSNFDEMAKVFYKSIMESKGECIVAVTKDNVNDIINDKNIPEKVRKLLKEHEEDINDMSTIEEVFLYTSIAMCKYFNIIMEIENKLDLKTAMSFFVATSEHFMEDKDPLFKAKKEILTTKINNIINKEFDTSKDNTTLGMSLMIAGFRLLEEEEDSLVFDKDNIKKMVDVMIVESIKELGVEKFMGLTKKETQSLFDIFDIDISDLDSIKEKYKDIKNNKDNLSDDDLKDILKK